MTLSSRRILPLLLIAFSFFILSSCKDQSRKVVKIGYMNCNNEQETKHRFVPLTRYLSDKVGVEFVMVPVDTHDFEKRFNQGEFAFTHTNSLIYIVLKERKNLTLVASEKRGNFGSRSGGAIIARKGSGIEKLEQIKGKKFAFGPMLAPTGYLAEYDLMLRSGIDPEKDFASYTIPSGSFKHEKLIYGVMFGEYDVSAATLMDLEVMTKEGKITADDFTILAQTPLIPYCTFGAAANADPALVEKVRKALLELKPTDTADVDGEKVKVMKAAWIDGYEALVDKDYDPVREMAKRVNMPPYQKF
ncbi:MAG: phosphate/phosphite/phosphonate ABC transporter substrate-binding protein [Geobacteraceae bacterium]|nr:phosphate/phosphite/phosphonate ABC transporter substrate-binding protein [Geobacteraceae bacterium]